MDKHTELQKLDGFIATMPDTYIGDWLQDQRDAIINAMGCDTMVYAETFSQRYERAKRDYQDIITRAELDAAKLIKDAETKITKTRKQYEQHIQHVYELGKTLQRAAQDM